jgi:hypothetical protein
MESAKQGLDLVSRIQFFAVQQPGTQVEVYGVYDYVYRKNEELFMIGKKICYVVPAIVPDCSL